MHYRYLLIVTLTKAVFLGQHLRLESTLRLLIKENFNFQALWTACTEIIDAFGFLKGHCHGDFAVCWSKMLKCLTKNIFSNIKLLLEHREEDMKLFLCAKINYYHFLAIFPSYIRGGT